MSIDDLTSTQQRFLRLHVRHTVEKWQWHFGNTQLRAEGGGHRVTIWVDELNDLCKRALMFKGLGSQVHATMDGRELFR